jgi:LacI family transcriptional regulator
MYNHRQEGINMATMKEIAERLGVSLGTVSKGLNGGRDIS